MSEGERGLKEQKVELLVRIDEQSEARTIGEGGSVVPTAKYDRTSHSPSATCTVVLLLR